MKYTCVGDVIIQRRIHEGYEGINELMPFIEKGDARFFNLEATLNKEGSCPASQFSGGTYIRAEKEMFYDVLGFGFNMTTFNNNHAMDFSYEGFGETLRILDESGIAHAGAGRNLAEASRPAYLGTQNGKIAMVSVSTSFEPCMMAGEESPVYPGRSGVNGIRLSTCYTVKKEDIEYIRALSRRTGANANAEIERNEGYLPPLPENQAEFGMLCFSAGEREGVMQTANEADMQRVRAAIAEAKRSADSVIVSVHSHQIHGSDKENVPDFLQKMCRSFIDFGADAVIGHGPHLLRPIEVYHDRPIFYSLGDFILQLYSVPSAPADFYNNYGVSPSAGIYELLKKRSDNFTRGLMEQRVMFETVIPYWEIKNGTLTELTLLPVELFGTDDKLNEGLPHIASADPQFIKRLGKMCAPYGVMLKTNGDGTVSCLWH